MPVRLILLSIVFCFWLPVKAQVVQAVQNGYWSDTATWSAQTIPTASDSVFINKYVWADTPIIMNDSGFLLIDSCGTLCGAEYIAGSFTNYGSINLDSARITDSTYNYGFFTFTYYIVVRLIDGGYMHNCCGGYGNVGTAPDCEPYSSRNATCSNSILSLNDEDTEAVPLAVSPNPCNDYFEVQMPNQAMGSWLEIFNIEGLLVLKLKLQQGKNVVYTTDFVRGLYFIKWGTQTAKLVKN